MRHRVAVAPLLASILLVGSARRTRAQDDGSVRLAPAPTDRLTLTVHGKVNGVADEVEIEFVVEASNEEAAEAERLHRAKLKKVLKTLEELRQALAGEKAPESEKAAKAESHQPGSPARDDEDAPRVRKKKAHAADDDDEGAPGTSKAKKRHKPSSDDADADAPEDAGDGLQVPIVVREGRSIFGLSRDDGQQPTDKGTQVTVATAVLVVMKGIADAPRVALRKRVARIVDAAIEAGCDSGGVDSGGPVGHGVRPAFRFKVKDNEALRDAAYKVAVSTGRARAEHLAHFAGREVETLSIVRETGWQLRAGMNDDGVGFDVVVGRLGNNKPNNHDLLVSTTECELEVQLELEFQLKPIVLQEPAPPTATK